MATLTHPDGVTVTDLMASTLVGRSRRADLVLSSQSSSSEHALLRWMGDGWQLRDLGSRNGTFVDDRPVGPGERVDLKVGARLRFGTSGQEWVFSADHPPVARARCEGQVVLAEGGMLCLPPEQDPPEITLFEDQGRRWVMERDGESAPAPATVEVGGRAWTLHLPEAAVSTHQSQTLGLQASRLSFQVSGDEETIRARITSGGRAVDLGERSHHYLLLHLARARLRDREEGCAPEEEGWVYREDLTQALRMDIEHVNVQIHRARRQLAAEGIGDAAQIVERRSQAGQLRLGVWNVEVAQP